MIANIAFDKDVSDDERKYLTMRNNHDSMLSCEHCPDSAIGQRVCLRNRRLRVRVPVGARHARMMDALETIHHELVEPIQSDCNQ